MSRRLIAIAIGALPVVGVAVACSFPDVTFGPAPTLPGQDAATGSDAQGTVDGRADLADSGLIGDAAGRDDASQRIDPDACAPTNCDCDGDHFAKANCDAGDVVDAAILPGVDCDDLDPLRHPDAGWVEAVPIGHDGDWNCDGTTEKGVKHVDCQGTGLTSCNGSTNGFQTDPSCGSDSTFYKCEGDPIAPCTPIPNGQAKQYCK